jgi:hypothetical protein
MHESRHVLKKDNSAAGDIVTEKAPCSEPVYLFERNNCKVHEKPDEKHKVEHKHFDPGTVRTDCHPADPVAELKGMREQPDFVKV